MSTPATTIPLQQQLEELESLSVAQLRERYRQVFGEESRSGNRQWLYRRVAWRLQALAEGDLSERARARAAELARDADVRVRAPAFPVPPNSPTAATGAPRANVPPTAGTSRRFAVSGTIGPTTDRRLPAPGTVLTRAFKGQVHEVTVLPGGFEYRGKPFKSLSAVATAITGSHWNGFLFFGLTGKETP